MMTAAAAASLARGGSGAADLGRHVGVRRA